MQTRDRTDLVLLASIWGASYLFMRMSSAEFGPVALIAARVVIAALVLLPFFLRQSRTAVALQHWRQLLVVGAMNCALPFCLIAYSTLHLSAGLAGVINASAPLFGAIIASVWLGEHLDGSRRVGLFIGFLGVMVLAWPTANTAPNSSTLAVLAALLAAACYGWGASYTRRHASHIDTLTAVTGSMLGASLVLLPFAVFMWPTTAISVSSWLAVIGLGAVCTGLAYLLYFRLISRIGPSGAISVTYLVPAFAVLWGMLFLGETITTSMVVGSVIILSGTALATGAMRLPATKSKT